MSAMDQLSTTSQTAAVAAASEPDAAADRRDYRARYVAQLQALAQRRDRAALATLQRGLRGNAAARLKCFPLVLPWLPDTLPPQRQDDCLLVAGLFAHYPDAPLQGFGETRATNLGATLRLVARAKEAHSASSAAGVERRFEILLRTSRRNLASALYPVIRLAKDEGAPVDWQRLLRDLAWWEAHMRVQSAWSRAFWRADAHRTEDC